MTFSDYHPLKTQSNIDEKFENWFLFEAKPSTDLVKFINSYKSASSRIIKKEYPFIKKSLWKSAFWKTNFIYNMPTL